jgi:cytochrome P450
MIETPAETAPGCPSFTPAYPKPRRKRASLWLMFFSARRSWLDALYERSYSMQMGEVHLPGLDMYMVNEPALVRAVLTEQADRFPKSALLGEALAPLLGESIFTTNGELWRSQRRMMEPAFAQARLNVAFPVMRQAADAMLARLQQLPDGASCDIEAEMTHVTADVIFRTIFSSPLEGADAKRVYSAFARYQALAPRLMLPSLFRARWLVWPWDAWRSRQAAREIRRLLEALVRPRYDARRRGEAHSHNDILASFLDAVDPQTGRPFAFDELVNQVAMLFLAGHETSASALTWACYLLAHSPEVQDRMHAEVVQVLGDRTPETGDMKQLTLTWNVFREALRLFPPVGFFAREAATACPMRDKQVPAGATVVVSPWLIQRHRQWWDRPDEFDPDRHAREESREGLRNAYLPFGMGPRVCMGAAFALQEAALILSGLMRHWRLEPVPGSGPALPVGRLTIRPAGGLKLKLRRRQATA